MLQTDEQYTEVSVSEVFFQIHNTVSTILEKWESTKYLALSEIFFQTILRRKQKKLYRKFFFGKNIGKFPENKIGKNTISANALKYTQTPPSADRYLRNAQVFFSFRVLPPLTASVGFDYGGP